MPFSSCCAGPQSSERVSLSCHLVSSSRNRLAASVLREDSTGNIRGGLGEQILEALMSQGLESVSPGQLEPMTHALALLAVLHMCRASCGWVCRRLGSNQHAEKRKARFQASQAVGTKVWDTGCRACRQQPRFSAAKCTPGTLQTQPLPLVSDALAPDTGI